MKKNILLVLLLSFSFIGKAQKLEYGLDIGFLQSQAAEFRNLVGTQVTTTINDTLRFNHEGAWVDANIPFEIGGYIKNQKYNLSLSISYYRQNPTFSSNVGVLVPNLEEFGFLRKLFGQKFKENVFRLGLEKRIYTFRKHKKNPLFVNASAHFSFHSITNKKEGVITVLENQRSKEDLASTDFRASHFYGFYVSMSSIQTRRNQFSIGLGLQYRIFKFSVEQNVMRYVSWDQLNFTEANRVFGVDNFGADEIALFKPVGASYFYRTYTFGVQLPISRYIKKFKERKAS